MKLFSEYIIMETDYTERNQKIKDKLINIFYILQLNDVISLSSDKELKTTYNELVKQCKSALNKILVNASKLDKILNKKFDLLLKNNFDYSGKKATEFDNLTGDIQEKIKTFISKLDGLKPKNESLTESLIFEGYPIILDEIALLVSPMVENFYNFVLNLKSFGKLENDDFKKFEKDAKITIEDELERIFSPIKNNDIIDSFNKIGKHLTDNNEMDKKICQEIIADIIKACESIIQKNENADKNDSLISLKNNLKDWSKNLDKAYSTITDKYKDKFTKDISAKRKTAKENIKNIENNITDDKKKLLETWRDIQKRWKEKLNPLKDECGEDSFEYTFAYNGFLSATTNSFANETEITKDIVDELDKQYKIAVKYIDGSINNHRRFATHIQQSDKALTKLQDDIKGNAQEIKNDFKELNIPELPELKLPTTNNTDSSSKSSNIDKLKTELEKIKDVQFDDEDNNFYKIGQRLIDNYEAFKDTMSDDDKKKLDSKIDKLIEDINNLSTTEKQDNKSDKNTENKEKTNQEEQIEQTETKVIESKYIETIKKDISELEKIEDDDLLKAFNKYVSEEDKKNPDGPEYLGLTILTLGAILLKSQNESKYKNQIQDITKKDNA